MANREPRRKRLNWIVSVIVMATVALLVMISVQGGEGFGESFAGIRDGIMRELWADDPSQLLSGAGSEENPLRVHFIDVGQGKSVLIEAPDKTVLIDAGENNQGETVLRYLSRQGIKKLDIVIGTHPHSDHIGGLDTVILAMRVDKVILPVIPEALSPTTPTYTDLLDAIASRELKITPARRGDEYDLGGGAALKILGPVRSDYTSLNDFSVVSRLGYGSVSFLFTGDATTAAEKDLLGSGAKLRASVLDIGHHGSRDSSSSSFLKAVGPRIAVISCAVDNSYGHPHRQAMRRLEELEDIKILRTDLDGSVIISSGGRELTYETEKN